MAEAPPPPLDAARPPEWTPHAPKAALEELAPLCPRAPRGPACLPEHPAQPARAHPDGAPGAVDEDEATPERCHGRHLRRSRRKCVVVSSIKPAVQHTVLALRGAGLDCVSVAKGDSADAMQEAAEKMARGPRLRRVRAPRRRGGRGA